MTPPSRPTASLAPVCSGCQCVLINVSMRLLPVTSLTAVSSASALAASPPSIISAPSLPGIAITLHPEPWSNVTPPRPVVEIRGEICHALAAYEGISALPSAAAPLCRKRRRDNRFSVGRGLVDWLMNLRLAQRPDVLPDALGWTQNRPHRASIHQFGRAQLAQKRRLLLVQRSLQRHEGHEASGLRIVQRRQAVLILGVHVDAVGGELPDDLFVALADGVVQRRSAPNLLPVIDQGDDVDVRTSF